MLFLAYEMPFLSMKCIDSVTFWNEQKLAHSLKMFQSKFAAARTITVEVSKLQCQMLQSIYKKLVVCLCFCVSRFFQLGT